MFLGARGAAGGDPGAGGTFGPVAGGPDGGGNAPPPGVKSSSANPTGFPLASNTTPGDIGIAPRSVSVPVLPGGTVCSFVRL